MNLNRFRLLDHERDTYAARYQCMTCRAVWVGRVTDDPAQRDVWPQTFLFCPCCGTRFTDGELPRSAATERRHELRAEASYRKGKLGPRNRVAYELQTYSEYQERWVEDSGYFSMATHQDILNSWRERLAKGSWFSEKLRVVAFTTAGIKVVFGPILLAEGTHVDQRDDD